MGGRASPGFRLAERPVGAFTAPERREFAMTRPLRLGIAGIHIESSTFSPLWTRRADFLATRGGEMLGRYPFLSTPAFEAVRPLPLAHFRALPGGRVARDDYEALKAEILGRLDTAGPLDAFYLDVHGAMAVDGLDDAETDLLGALRARLPPGLPVTCSQDLHGNVTDDFVAAVDFITTYRTAPHVDWMETRERAVRLLLDWWNSPRPVFRARVGIPVLVSGEMSSTQTEPGRGLHAPLAAESGLPEILDASLWVGYAWADQARSMAASVVTGTAPAAVRGLAESIALRYWRARDAFRFVAPAGPVEWCLREALALESPAVFLSDAGDNPTAGAAGDVPATLAALVAEPAFAADGGATAVYASMPDAGAIEACRESSPGAELSLALGGKLDPLHGRELPLTVTLLRPVVDDPLGGGQTVVRHGGVHIILTERRRPFHRRADFLELGLDPLDHRLTVVKIGYLEPELKAMARHHFLVLSPGAVPPDLLGIDYRQLRRPIHPLDRDFAWQPVATLHRSLG